jgi:NADH-quinone oxidoreductase subunit A
MGAWQRGRFASSHLRRDINKSGAEYRMSNVAQDEFSSMLMSVSQYLPLLGLLVLGVLFASGSFLASSLLAPKKRPTDAKLAPYECGIVPEFEPPARFPVRFFLVAMIFVIFDIEVVFLYPFAVMFRSIGLFGLVEIGIFSLTVFGALLFLVSEGALSWGPTVRLVKAMPTRTSSSTVVRIATEQEKVA